MSPDPDNAGATLGAPQSWNAYSYVLNNPLNLIDPQGLDCVYLDNNGGTNSNGPGGFSVDHNSSQAECESKDNGGTWLDGTIAESSVYADPNSNWVSGINNAGQKQGGCNGSSDQCSDEAFSAFFGDTQKVLVRGSDQEIDTSPSANAGMQALHDAFAPLPTVCSITFSLNAGAPTGRMRFGMEYNTDKGFAWRGRAQGGAGPVKARVTATSNGKISTSVRVGGTVGGTMGFDGTNISSVGVSVNLTKFVSAGVSGQVAPVYSCKPGSGSSSGAE
jgi:hypothetical protein